MNHVKEFIGMTIQNRAKPSPKTFALTQINSQIEIVVLQPRENTLIKAKSQYLVVLEGVAWITMDGQDYVAQVGDSYQLVPTQDSYPIRVSALGGRPLIYSLKRTH
jgi:hypothetical protein